MWLTSFRPFLLQHLRLCGFLRCTDAQWDATCGQIVPRKTTRFGTLYHKFQLVSGFIYAVGIILKISRGKDSVAEKCQGVVFLTILVVTILARWYWPREGQLNEPCRMLNACFRFEKFLITGYGTPVRQPSILDKVMIAFLRLLAPTAFLVPFAVIAIQLHNPCALPFIGSWSPYCVNSVWSPPPRLVHCLMLATDWWIWAHFEYDGALYVFYAFMVSIVCMLDYLEHFEKFVREIRTSSSPVPDLRTLEIRVTKSLHTYRCVRLINKTLNHATQGQLVPAMIGVAPQLQVFAQFVCIKLYSKIPLPGFLFFPLLVVDSTICNLIVESMAAKVNTNSVKLLSDLNRELKGLPVKSSCRKELRACTAAKIQFGQNFVDKGTPLVIENFCFNQTVSLLLLNSRNQRNK
ncbi:hypothetical protein Fcan01_00133 [Folsomia candida]|uniref:Gustatory receptor n=1 Tax=Folsomia candida TaxID=158441 RepID=A0A226F3N1_FOLCA|nr:hypothetical protein Fcan01_00133 [Folsomia candida]